MKKTSVFITTGNIQHGILPANKFDEGAVRLVFQELILPALDSAENLERIDKTLKLSVDFVPESGIVTDPMFYGNNSIALWKDQSSLHYTTVTPSGNLGERSA